MKYIITCVALILVTFVSLTVRSKRPNNLGLKNGQFALCPQRDNCVSSQSTVKKHQIFPIQATGNSEAVLRRLSNAIESLSGSKIVESTETYIHAEFTSRVFRFVDDLECYYNKEKDIIEIRSASRIGYTDFGTNRSRVEKLRKVFLKL